MDKGQNLVDLIREKDTFGQKLGIEIIEAENGTSRVRMTLDESTANAVGNAHGGVLYTIADFAFAAACNSEGDLSVAIEGSIQYMAPCPSNGVVEAIAKKTRDTRRLGFYRIDIGRPGEKPVAQGQFVCYKMKPRDNG